MRDVPERGNPETIVIMPALQAMKSKPPDRLTELFADARFTRRVSVALFQLQ
jgi:hypothetical protein